MKNKFFTFALAFAAICMISCEGKNDPEEDLSAYNEFPAFVEQAYGKDLAAIKESLAANGYKFVKSDDNTYFYFAPQGKTELADALCANEDMVEGTAIVFYDWQDGNYCFEAYVVSSSKSAIKTLKNTWSTWVKENLTSGELNRVTTESEDGLQVAKYIRANNKEDLED